MAVEKVPCRYCKNPVDKGVKRCPHCGTHNPSMNAKRAMVWTVVTILLLYVTTFVWKKMQG